MQRTALCDFCGDGGSSDGSLVVVRVGNHHTGDACHACAANIRVSVESTMTEASKAYYKKLLAQPVHRGLQG